MEEKVQDLETQKSLASFEATIESNVQRGSESSCNNNNDETSAVTSDADHEKSLQFAEELMEKGSKAEKENDYAEATEFYSRALEIRVSHHGELSPFCVTAYYKYGRALLYKAQDEADPLGAVPKKEVKSEQEPNKDVSVTSAKTGQTSGASKSSNADEGGSSKPQEGSGDDENGGKDMEEDEGEDASDAEDLAEGDEDDSDLDLAWKMLDVARLIVEKNSDETVEKVDILSTLAEVALEREDIETSLSDYLKALSMLERVVEPDSRLIAELNFRICLCLETGSKAQEAIPYCEKAISVCKTRVESLQGEIKAKSDISESDLTAQISSSANQTINSVEDKEAEIETLTGLCSDLEKKLEDLQQLVSNPTSILSDILGLVSAKAKANLTSGSSSSSSASRIGAANSTYCFESATISTMPQTNDGSEVKHLGVVGRGVKRLQNPTEVSSECNAEKKQAVDPSENQDS